jgi:dihydrolipoamide dehydrogenase
MKKIKVAIIGAGSAGLSARREVAKVTEDYLVFDGGILGTTCARVGCMPSKVLIQAGEDVYKTTKFHDFGVYGQEHIKVNLPEVLTHVRKLRDRFVRAVEGGMKSWVDTHLIREHVELTGLYSLKTHSGEEYEFEKVIITTGTSPYAPEVLKGFESYLYSSDTIFEQVDLPEKIAVLGLGVIGIELGQALHRLGVNILGINRRRSISGILNPEINEYACKYFEKEMNLNFSGLSSVKEVDERLELTLGDGSKHTVDKILLSNGRKLNLDKINLSPLLHIKDKRGLPPINLETFQIEEHHHMFIAGDLTGDKQLLHEASDEGKIAGHNAVRSKPDRFKTRTPIGITFSDPNIAFCGQYYKQLIEEKVDFQVGQVTFEGQGRSIIKLKEVGLLHIYADTKTGKILGAEMMGPDNEHLAHLLAWCIQMNLTVNEVLEMPFYHPVVEEGMRTALRDLRHKLDPEPNVLELRMIND